MSEFNKDVGKRISKAEADRLKQNWQKSGIKTKSSFFGSNILLSLLQTPGAVGIRIHYGMDSEGNMQPVLTAELDNSNTSTMSTDDDGGADASLPCPPFCPTGG